MSKQGVQDLPRSPAHQVAGNAIMLRPGPNCTDHRRCGDQRGDVHRRRGGGGGVSARAVTDSRQSPGAPAHCSAEFYIVISGWLGSTNYWWQNTLRPLLIISQLTNELQA